MIRVCCDYDFNCNTAVFDNLSLIKDTVKSYTYDDEGNTVSTVDNAQNKSTFEYQDNDLVKQNNPTGYSYNYTYDEKHNLLTALSENNVKYSFTYDNFGNPLTMMQSSPDGSLNINSSATYTANGNYLSTLTDARGNSSAYVYGENTGLLTKFTDALDNRTLYAYNLDNKRLTAVAYDKNKNGQGDDPDTIVNYAYSKGRLSTITHNGFTYGFTYDDFGNMLTTSAGGNTLVTNTYGSNNGMLLSSQYGNGYYVDYEYDRFNRVAAEKHNGSVAYHYIYDNNGNIKSLSDKLNDIDYNYEYDFIGRLVRSFVTKDSANYLTSQVKYDEYNRLTHQKYILADGTKHNYQYHYNNLGDNLLAGVSLPYSRTLTYTYDSLNRPETKTLSGGTASISESYEYFSPGTYAATPLLSKITYNDESYLKYTYNAVNNIIAIVDESGNRTTYKYDGLGQLIRENNPHTNKTYIFTYDKGGNITSITNYAYTTSSTLGTATNTITYTYGDSNWKDKLTNYNGTAITYDSIGNPLNYRNGTLTWNGRQLASFTNASGYTANYIYNSDGVRIGKSGAKNVSYVVSGTQILSETNGTTTTYYIYDDKGLPIGLVYNGTTYTYRKNLQGDIIAILDGSGTEVVTYVYNAWGAHKTYGTLKDTLGKANPFRYRGYYYDTESTYYYLNSRYYDPITGRFLNADTTSVLTASPMGLTDKNLYAYCDNNPVMRVDVGGEFWNVIIGAVIGGTINMVSSIISEVIEGDFTLSDIGQIALSTAIGAVEGAAIALCPAASVAFSATASALDTAVNGIIDGDSVGEIVTNSLLSGAIGAVAGSGGSDFVKGGKLINEAAGSLGNAVKKGVHPVVKKAAKKTIKKAAKSIAKSYVSGQVEDIAYGGLYEFSSFYIRASMPWYSGRQ